MADVNRRPLDVEFEPTKFAGLKQFHLYAALGHLFLFVSTFRLPGFDKSLLRLDEVPIRRVRQPNYAWLTYSCSKANLSSGCLRGANWDTFSEATYDPLWQVRAARYLSAERAVLGAPKRPMRS